MKTTFKGLDDHQVKAIISEARENVYRLICIKKRSTDEDKQLDNWKIATEKALTERARRAHKAHKDGRVA